MNLIPKTNHFFGCQGIKSERAAAQEPAKTAAPALMDGILQPKPNNRYVSRHNTAMAGKTHTVLFCANRPGR